MSAFAPDLAPAAWKLPIVLVGLLMVAVSLLPRLKSICDLVLRKGRAGQVTLILVSLILAGAAIYTGYRGFRGDQLAPELESAASQTADDAKAAIDLRGVIEIPDLQHSAEAVLVRMSGVLTNKGAKDAYIRAIKLAKVEYEDERMNSNPRERVRDIIPDVALEFAFMDIPRNEGQRVQHNNEKKYYIISSPLAGDEELITVRSGESAQIKMQFKMLPTDLSVSNVAAFFAIMQLVGEDGALTSRVCPVAFVKRLMPINGLGMGTTFAPFPLGPVSILPNNGELVCQERPRAVSPPAAAR